MHPYFFVFPNIILQSYQYEIKLKKHHVYGKYSFKNEYNFKHKKNYIKLLKK